MLKQSFLFAACMAWSLTVFAQMTDMKWDTHGVEFKVPSDAKITTNNAEEFSAENANLALTIVPIQDGELNEEHMADATIEMAKELGYDNITDGDAVEIDDFKGYYLRGTKDGVNALVMALLDSRSTTNLLVVIVYADRFEKQSLDIANSFSAYD